jgi:hypothetical protein
MNQDRGPQIANHGNHIPLDFHALARALRRALLTLAAMVSIPCPADPVDPEEYVRGSDWRASLLAALEAIGRGAREDGFAPFESAAMRGGEPARAIRVELHGAKDLFLFVTGVPDAQWAVADWADARLIRPDGTSEPLFAAPGLTVLLGRCERDITLKSGLRQKLRLDGRTFDRGLNVQADSALHVPLRGEFARFEATIGSRWLSQRLGEEVALPDEAQWEWAYDPWQKVFNVGFRVIIRPGNRHADEPPQP